MNSQGAQGVAAALAYIEAHLDEKLDLAVLAAAAGYSKYHLHRLFAGAVGLPLHSYIQRRRLTEAARLLVFTQKPILEVALAAGYESQQAFGGIFRALYKQTPLACRQSGVFYPLQLAPDLGPGGAPAPKSPLPPPAYARPEDLDGWMGLLPLVVGGFPHLEEGPHRERVKRYIQNRQALILRDGATVAGAAAFSPGPGSIDFLAVHPRYRRAGVEEALVGSMARREFAGRPVSITTFREGDRADPGQRVAYLRLGFTGAQLLTEFGYPTQRLILPPGRQDHKAR